MLRRRLIGIIALAVGLAMTFADARAFDETKYPDWGGQWKRPRGLATQWDQTKPSGLGQQAPLKPEFQAILEANLKEQATGGQGGDPTYACISPGMPRIMNPYGEMEIVITPDTTHILLEHIHDSRRIFTDGRAWPTGYTEATYRGYSIGKWLDTDGDGRFDTLEVETRNLRGPRAYDPSGLPFHDDNETVVTERIYLDKSNPNLMHNEMTVVDHALTHPWSVHKKYERNPKDLQPVWYEDICPEGQAQMRVGKERYYLSADGYLMPVKKGQAPPDPRYFERAGK